MKRAKIIVIEGTDGSGKETQSKKVEEYYKSKGLKIKRYSFPCYDTPTGKIVGGPYLGKKEICDSYFEETSAYVDPLVSSLYYAADRRYNFLKFIEAEIYQNDIIILDRYTTSNMGHQAGKAKTKDEEDKILKFIEMIEFEYCELPRPDAVIFLYMPFEASKELRKGRTSGDGNENSEEHLRKAEQTYTDIAKRYNWYMVNCLNKDTFSSLEDIKSIDEINTEILSYLDNELAKENATIKRMTRF